MAPPEVVSTVPFPLAVKERPILFSAPMVRAMLDGSKTQTRRVVKWHGLEPGLNLQFSGLSVERSGSNWVLSSPTRDSYAYRSIPMPCPYGLPGDRLWVRETYFAFGRWETRFSAKKGRNEWHFVDMTLECGHEYAYAADGHSFAPHQRTPGTTPCWWKRPAIFMPRAASRIDLEETDVRVERLQDICETDARAEGISYGPTCDEEGRSGGFHWDRSQDDEDVWPTAVQAYMRLWEQINAAGRPVLPFNPNSKRYARVAAWLKKHPDSTNWAANPWVWVVEFRRAVP